MAAPATGQGSAPHTNRVIVTSQSWGWDRAPRSRSSAPIATANLFDLAPVVELGLRRVEAGAELLRVVPAGATVEELVPERKGAALDRLHRVDAATRVGGEERTAFAVGRVDRVAALLFLPRDVVHGLELGE